MIPAGMDEEARAVMALAEAKIAELGPKRFGSEYGIPAGVWWEIYLLAEGGYSARQIAEVIDERIADHFIDDPNDPYFAYQEWPDKTQRHVDVLRSARAAISVITG